MSNLSVLYDGYSYNYEMESSIDQHTYTLLGYSHPPNLRKSLSQFLPLAVVKNSVHLQSITQSAFVSFFHDVFFFSVAEPPPFYCFTPAPGLPFFLAGSGYSTNQNIH